MSFESISGIGAGLAGMVLSVLGINKYYSVKMSNDLGKKQDKEICLIFHNGIEDKFKTIVEVQKDIKTELRDLNNYIRSKTNRPD